MIEEPEDVHTYLLLDEGETYYLHRVDADCTFQDSDVASEEGLHTPVEAARTVLGVAMTVRVPSFQGVHKAEDPLAEEVCPFS